MNSLMLAVWVGLSHTTCTTYNKCHGAEKIYYDSIFYSSTSFTRTIVSFITKSRDTTWEEP